MQFDAVLVGAGLKHAAIPKAAFDYFNGPTFHTNVALAKRLAPVARRLVLSATHGLLTEGTTAWHATPSRAGREWAARVEADLLKLLGKKPRVLALCTEGLLAWAPAIRAAGGVVEAPIADLTSSQHRALGRFAETAPRDLIEFRKLAKRVARGQA